MRRLESAEARATAKELSRTRSERVHRQLTLGALLIASGLPEEIGPDLEAMRGGLLVLLDAYRACPTTAKSQWLERLVPPSAAPAIHVKTAL